MNVQAGGLAFGNAYPSSVAAIYAANMAQSGKILPGSVNASGIPSTSMDRVNLTRSMSLSEIANKYDVQNMSPRQVVALGNELLKSGAISEQDAFVLTFQPAMKLDNNNAGAPGWSLNNPDAPSNLLSQWQATTELNASVGNAVNVMQNQKIANILGNLAALRPVIAV